MKFNLNIGQKLAGGFGIVIVLFLVTLMLIFNILVKNSRQNEYISQEIDPLVENIDRKSVV